ncbi:HAD family hydrolase [Conexibacter sp. SYSU D00693]|uniref:HAD family hydrolase n=1 Tax=Conexibacter sp. SYSU D00693 TaxID=2812560 RepID=UPI00196B7499|nr:HAD-IA family hydrolase [Conexibacter sp. SYSU D00693]
MRAVLLDAMGTLVGLEPPAPLLRAQLAARGVDVSEEEAAAALRAEIAFYREYHGMARDRAGLDDLRDRCTAVLAGALPPAARELGDLRDVLLASLRFAAFPEVPAALDALRAAGLRLVVCSNWDVSLHDVLRETGLRERLDAVVTSAEVGAAKPDGRTFAAALHAAGCRAREALHVGDDLEADVRGARAAGIAAVLVDRAGAGAPAGVRVVRGLDELPTAAI